MKVLWMFFKGRMCLRLLVHVKVKLDILVANVFFFERILCICVELTELFFQFCGRRGPSTAQEYKGGL